MVGLGCNNFGMRCDEDASIEVIHAALDAGINFFDTADIYGQRGLSEEYLGRALKGKDRDEIIIGTKFANPMNERTLRGLNIGRSVAPLAPSRSASSNTMR